MNNSLRFFCVSFSKLFVFFAVTSLFSCQQNFIPKPGSYFRIDFPEKEYKLYEGDRPIIFEYPVYGVFERDDGRLSEDGWYNIRFPKYKATIHLTYKTIDNNFDDFFEDQWRIVYNRISMRADAIFEREYLNEEINVYGMMFDIHGDAASSVQFFVTDSIRHFLRGALYFTVSPNADSLAPAVAFFREDIIRIMESVEWKN